MVHTSYQVFRPFALENQGEQIVKKKVFFLPMFVSFLDIEEDKIL